jgi:hypothetical protein
MQRMLLSTVLFFVFPCLHAMELQPEGQKNRQNVPWLHRVVGYGSRAALLCVSMGLPWLTGSSVANDTTHIIQAPDIFNETKIYDPIAQQRVLIGVASMVGLSLVTGLASCVVSKYCRDEKKNGDILTKPCPRRKKCSIREQYKINKASTMNVEEGYEIESSHSHDLNLPEETFEIYTDQIDS